MTIYIPEWLLWVIGVPVGIIILFLASLGLRFIIALSDWNW